MYISRVIRVSFWALVVSIQSLLVACSGSGTAEPTPTPTPLISPPPVQTDVAELTFNITVPDDTPTDARVYISGDFESWSGGSADKPEYEAVLQSDGRYRLTLELRREQLILYKFTRGGWETVETDETGNSVGNRAYKLENMEQQIDLSIGGWSDVTPQQSSIFWQTPTPDFSDDPDRPIITISGAAYINLNIGDSYIDAGATATDAQDGDLSTSIVVTNNVNAEVAGDYLVRYAVSDSDNNRAIEAVRIVRVYDTDPARQTLRPVGSTESHLGYVEHLPVNFGSDPQTVYPLIISNHGGGANADLIGGSPYSALSNMVEGDSMGLVIKTYGWDDDLPFIVLSPQRGEAANVSTERIKAFIDYAMKVYPIDPQRIYMTGWSQGAYTTFKYIVDYPGTIAAAVPIAGGFLRTGVPANVCAATDVSVWAFHGDSDAVVDASKSREAISAISTCPRTPAPRYTQIVGGNHFIHGSVFTQSVRGQGDASYDPYNENIYQWLLSKRLGTP